MKDRQPKYPGRVKLVPVDGQENTYDLIMADEPTEEGTPPTKGNLLSDETAAMYLGFSEDSTVNDALAVLGNAALFSENGFQTPGGTKIQQAKIVAGSYTGNGSTTKTLSFPFKPELVFVSLAENDGSPGDNSNYALICYGKYTVLTYHMYQSFRLANVSWRGNTLYIRASRSGAGANSVGALNLTDAKYLYVAFCLS